MDTLADLGIRGAGHRKQIAIAVGEACTQAVSVAADSAEVELEVVDSVAAAVSGAETRRGIKRDGNF